MRRVAVKSKVAGDFNWVDRENSLHLLLAYNSLPVSPCASSAIGPLLLCFQVGPHHLPTSAPPIPRNSNFTTSTCVICQLGLYLSLFAIYSIIILTISHHLTHL